jgi:glutamate racemase
LNSPIGVFDSGLGGLSVAAKVLERLPDETIIYLADNAHVPYGERPLEEIREFAVGITDYLIGRGAKAVVMACNMSSAIALDAVRQRHPDVPVIGVIEPGAAAAVRACGGDPIGILATTGTVRSGAYPRSIAQLDPSVRVVQQACSKFVPLVESGKSDSEEAEAAACGYVLPLVGEGCRTLVLGCTHYPFLRRAIEAAAGPSVSIVDPAEETVRALKNELEEARLLSTEPAGVHEFCATGDTRDFAFLGSRFLGRDIASVKELAWGVDLGCVSGLPLQVRP